MTKYDGVQQLTEFQVAFCLPDGRKIEHGFCGGDMTKVCFY